jgi:TatD DNase family protein
MKFAESTGVGISDVHAHLQDGRFGDDLTVYFERAQARGVRRFVCCGTSPADWKKTAEIAKKYPNVFPTFGVHPWNVGRIDGDWATALKMMLDGTRSADGVYGAALGEVGLDFAVRDLDAAAQEAALRTQLEIANERRLPVVVHSVRANDLTLKILRDYSKVPVWLLHSWTASEEQIERALASNVFFSFSPRCVAPNAVRARETVAKVPRDRILVESDAPTPLPPNGYGKPLSPIASFAVEARDADGVLLSAPASVVDVAEEIAALRKTPVDEFYRQLALNEKRFFQCWPTC